MPYLLCWRFGFLRFGEPAIESGPSRRNYQLASKHGHVLRLKVSEGAVLDVIALNGLDGHTEPSWTARGNPWLQDLLGPDITHIRVLTYAIHDVTTGYTALDRHADNLVNSLHLYRSNSQTTHRPIIFITNRLGGLVLKLALVKVHQSSAQNEDAAFLDLKLSTSGIIYLETSHQDPPTAYLRGIFKQLQSAFTGRRVKAKASQQRERDNAVIDAQLAEYDSIRHKFDIKHLHQGTRDERTVSEHIIDKLAKAVSNGPATSKPTDPIRPSPTGILCLYEPADPQHCVVDIVAIHGLGGHREDTWTKDNFLWLRDLLPKDLPATRVLTYGYDTTVTDVRPWPPNGMKDQGSDLVLRLKQYRHNTQSTGRPIIFIAHSLGGVMLKYALLKSSQSRVGHLEDHLDIKLSTYGIIFLGTPHTGSNRDDLLLTFRRIQAALTGTDINSGITYHLEQEAAALANQPGEFLCISNDFETKFLYEHYATPVCGEGVRLIVPRVSAVVSGAANVEVASLHRDHIHLTKFSGPDDPDYTLIRDFIQRMMESCQDKIRHNWDKNDRMKAIQLERYKTAVMS